MAVVSAPARVCPKCHSEYDQSSARCSIDGSLLLDLGEAHDGDTPAFGTPVVPDSLGELGPYKLLAKLGEGTMAIVYAAEHSKLGRRSAIKRLRPEHLVDHEIVHRFLAEARTIASIQHPNLVTIYDVVEEPGETYLVMELLDGRDLLATLQTGPVQMERALRIAIEICDALVPVHARGIIHRDIKPANVFLSVTSGREQVKMLDFGAARLLGGGSLLEARMEAAGKVLGSPAYMSPEQIGGEELDARSDVYAVGVVLYEMLSGKAPFLGVTPSDVMLQHLHQAPKPPTVGSVSVPREVEKLVLRCLAKRREDRFASAAELAQELRRVGAPLGVDPLVVSARSSGSMTVIDPSVQTTSPPVLRFALGAVLLLAASTALAYRLLHDAGPTRGMVDATPATRTVRIETVPAGVFARSDSTFAGCVTPCTLDLPLGETSISLDLQNFDSTKVRLAPGEQLVRAELKPSSATVVQPVGVQPVGVQPTPPEPGNITKRIPWKPKKGGDRKGHTPDGGDRSVIIDPFSKKR